MYNYFISLGWFCGTASSLSKYGFRDFSGPFDWYYSDLQGVIHFLETDFEDFLCRDNLQIVEGKPREFIDVKYGMHYNHDVKVNFEAEYDDIFAKYQRRIARIRKQMKKSVCFVRAVRNQGELDYIIHNKNYIQSVIKKENEHNEIIFLLLNHMKLPRSYVDGFYNLGIDVYCGNGSTALRSMCDNCEMFLDFCRSNYDEQRRKDNVILDRNRELEKLSNLEIRHAILLHIVKTDFSTVKFPQKLAIYGVGDNGRIFYDKIKTYCSITCFIDAAPQIKEYKGISVIPIQSYVSQPDVPVVITPVYAFDAIASNLKEKCNVSKENLISVFDF